MKYSDAVRIDRTKWDREEIFSFFSQITTPYYALSFTVNVTGLLKFCRENKISFYLSLIHLATRAMNSVENFRYTIRDGEVWLLKERHPSYTDMHPGTTLFHVVTPEWHDSREVFVREAAAFSAAQDRFIDLSRESDDLIFFSCVPGLRMTGLSAQNDDPDDCIPSLTWGQYETRDGRTELNMTMEVNHRVIDGIHIAMFAKKLGELIDAL